ncbi:probable E3 ubiquitin-protein ligase IRF2BPL [Neodiprion virginianus]|uniref:probable E3 ubiquitin-protein ligase IRF2BPL n=1 Tax=Neodiprion virginianus TaxID=2961670 RepID=UPI001EE769EA|nr:probable E3 ubiquitin-protein ligase IRF2BPL [Neodiprion virginianus]
MRRPGTLPCSGVQRGTSSASGNSNTGTNNSGSLHHQQKQQQQHHQQQQQQQQKGDVTCNGINGTAPRIHHMANHSLRRNHQASSTVPALPARGGNENGSLVESGGRSSCRSSLQNGIIPGHPPPPPRSHPPSCNQSSYPTLTDTRSVVFALEVHYLQELDFQNKRSVVLAVQVLDLMTFDLRE